MPSGPSVPVTKEQNSASPVLIPRADMLRTLPEKTLSSIKHEAAIKRGGASRNLSNLDSELGSTQATAAGYHLSPKTLRRLEHKHQVAKLQQEKQEWELSPPASPQTSRKRTLLKGAANRRFTVARTW